MQSSQESMTHNKKINNRNKSRSSRDAETGRQGP